MYSFYTYTDNLYKPKGKYIYYCYFIYLFLFLLFGAGQSVNKFYSSPMVPLIQINLFLQAEYKSLLSNSSLSVKFSYTYLASSLPVFFSIALLTVWNFGFQNAMPPVRLNDAVRLFLSPFP